MVSGGRLDELHQAIGQLHAGKAVVQLVPISGWTEIGYHGWDIIMHTPSGLINTIQLQLSGRVNREISIV